MGRSDAEAHCSVRFSLSHDTNEEDIAATLDAIAAVLEELETTIRFIPCK
jgi:cysteine sulfinate desulfinase/cysteine desulfurase-like protein